MSTVWEMLGPEKQREIELRASREMLAYHMGDPTPITTVKLIMEEAANRNYYNYKEKSSYDDSSLYKTLKDNS